MNLKSYSYRFAEEILGSAGYSALRDEVVDILARTPVPRHAIPTTRSRSRQASSITVDQGLLNQQIEDEFRKRSWDIHPLVVADKGTQLKADYKKDRVQVEVQFGNIARGVYDLFKLQVSYSQDLIDVGIIVVPMHTLAKEVGENIAYFERLVRELKYAKMSITLPIWVIGVAP